MTLAELRVREQLGKLHHILDTSIPQARGEGITLRGPHAEHEQRRDGTPP